MEVASSNRMERKLLSMRLLILVMKSQIVFRKISVFKIQIKFFMILEIKPFLSLVGLLLSKCGEHKCLSHIRLN
jgi:hypothetical protein